MLSNSLLHWLYIKPTWKCEDYCAIATWQSFWVIFGDVLHLFFTIFRWFLFKLAKQIAKTVGGRDSDSSYIYNYSFGHLEQKLSESCQKCEKLSKSSKIFTKWQWYGNHHCNGLLSLMCKSKCFPEEVNWCQINSCQTTKDFGNNYTLRQQQLTTTYWYQQFLLWHIFLFLSSRPVNLLTSQIQSIVRALHKQLREKSVKTRQVNTVFSLGHWGVGGGDTCSCGSVQTSFVVMMTCVSHKSLQSNFVKAQNSKGWVQALFASLPPPPSSKSLPAPALPSLHLQH